MFAIFLMFLGAILFTAGIFIGLFDPSAFADPWAPSRDEIRAWLRSGRFLGALFCMLAGAALMICPLGI